MTLDGDESMPDVLAAPTQSKRHSNNKAEQVWRSDEEMPAAAAPPASAEADEDTKSTRRGVHAKHTGPQLRREYADVELQSKYSHESVKEDKAKMHYSIRSALRKYRNGKPMRRRIA